LLSRVSATAERMPAGRVPLLAKEPTLWTQAELGAVGSPARGTTVAASEVLHRPPLYTHSRHEEEKF
jgi:hypothetical protein